ncbi:hypothetical protein GPJ56_010211 [Histomonas meleagridis]|uniref:uncharacterized protein n=1 Tax=Histomonas meleagridis TaxID=135588 RepID=UPI00355A52EA|nr:hypothetical protein GPJ56_010211 [Histomonas meleagridis]KAH0797080.1 hypothetical protein GO595_010973 [Histomonas meleagridis]
MLHMSQIKLLRDYVEKFFALKDAMFKAGFRKFFFADNGYEMIATFPSELKFHEVWCCIGPNAIRFSSADNENQRLSTLGTLIKYFLNYNFGDVETLQYVVQFVINLLYFDNRYIRLIMDLMKKLLDKTDELGIDWKLSMNQSAVLKNEMKVILVMALQTKNFTIEYTRKYNDTFEIIYVDGDKDQVKMRSSKELFRIIDNLKLESDSDSD